jgi:poly-beta-1,6-N-acetyl-D-glucosamine synthase
MHLSYVLITPARNEAKYIGHTLTSVIRQTIKPLRWTIISDSSKDGTDEIVTRYLADNPWIHFIRIEQGRERNFARKVTSFNAGLKRLQELTYDIIGNLDADVSFEPDYFEYLLHQFQDNPRLGVAGTAYVEGSHHSFKDSHVNIKHVHGQIQLFRKKCFQDIGGYQPIETGGIDWIAVTTARMKGWKTHSFQGKSFVHHRTMGTGNRNILGARFHYGQKDYRLGNHPLWEVLRLAQWFMKRPYCIGGLAMLAGFCWCYISKEKRSISKELLAFHRREQLSRLREVIDERRS